MIITKLCANCGEPFTRPRSRNTGHILGPAKFENRKYCSRACAASGRRFRWSDAALDRIRELLDKGGSFTAIAAEMSGTLGLGKLTKNHIAGAVHRNRDLMYQPAPPKAPAARAIQPVECAPDKPRWACHHGSCRNTRQPGREYCAEHQTQLVADLVPRVNVSNLDTLYGGR